MPEHHPILPSYTDPPSAPCLCFSEIFPVFHIAVGSLLSQRGWHPFLKDLFADLWEGPFKPTQCCVEGWLGWEGWAGWPKTPSAWLLHFGLISGIPLPTCWPLTFWSPTIHIPPAPGIKDIPVLLLVFALPAQPWVSPLRGTQYCEYQPPSIRYVYSTQHILFSYKTAPKHKPTTVSGVQVSQTRRNIGCTDITESWSCHAMCTQL